MRVRSLWSFVFALTLAPIIGCGGGDTGATKALDMGGEDGTKISVLIEDMNDAKGNTKKLAGLFAKGATPAAGEAKKLSPFGYTIVGKPTVNGSEATAKVSIRKEGSSEEIAQKDWSFVKEGDAWKIKSAPIQ